MKRLFEVSVSPLLFIQFLPAYDDALFDIFISHSFYIIIISLHFHFFSSFFQLFNNLGTTRYSYAISCAQFQCSTYFCCSSTTSPSLLVTSNLYARISLSLFSALDIFSAHVCACSKPCKNIWCVKNCFVAADKKYNIFNRKNSGDTHGQFRDLLLLFRHFGFPSNLHGLSCWEKERKRNCQHFLVLEANTTNKL